MICTFFGHRDAGSDIAPLLRETLIDLIENKSVDTFFVGNQGNFDATVIRTLSELSKVYDNIHFCVVLAYMPKQKYEYETVYPEGLENTPPRFAISKRNKWMVEKCDIAVVYIKRSVSGAAKFAEMAYRKSKTVINLAELTDEA